MLIHPDLTLAQAHDRQRDLIAEADRGRLLAVARRHRRGSATASPAARGRPEGRGARLAATVR
jgi:hypothetical protein